MGKRNLLFCLVLALAPCVQAQVAVGVGIGFGLSSVSIGFNVPVYPELAPVPGYPVYYGPGMSSNYFFYDGLYWVYQGDRWYESSWYNGPWDYVDAQDVPSNLLLVPVGYYRQPPPFFLGWQSGAAPHWGEHWGRDWEQRRNGWERGGGRVALAPLPVYQRQYAGDRYPRAEDQRALDGRNNAYQARDPQVRSRLAQRSPAGSDARQGEAPRGAPPAAPRSVPAAALPSAPHSGPPSGPPSGPRSETTAALAAAPHSTPPARGDAVPRGERPAAGAAKPSDPGRQPPARQATEQRQASAPRPAPQQHQAPEQRQAPAPRPAPEQHQAQEQAQRSEQHPQADRGGGREGSEGRGQEQH